MAQRQAVTKKKALAYKSADRAGKSRILDELKPWIARRERLEKFIIRRDPRDISRIWVLDPEDQNYVEVPYRTLSNPAVTLWEHRQALARLREQGRSQVDEVALFAMIGQMRQIVRTAQKDTRRSRRERERRGHLKEAVPPDTLAPPRDPVAAPVPLQHRGAGTGSR